MSNSLSDWMGDATKEKLRKDKLKLDRRERRLEKQIAARKYIGGHAMGLRRILRVLRRLLWLRFLYLKSKANPGGKLKFSTLERRARRAVARAS
jgi:hypothetical protein